MNEQTRKALELARSALEWPGEHDATQVIAAIDAALSAPAAPVAPTGWLRSGALIYRLTDDRNPINRDEIRVTMADGLRADDACGRRAGELFDMLSAPVAQPLTEGFVQVPVSALMELKADVNTLTCLSLRAERWQKGAKIKATISGLINGITKGEA